jgi:hypothetical protein
VAVVEQLDVGQPDRVFALDAQLEHQPVGKIDEILVEHGQAAQDRRLPVIDAVRVRAGVMHPVGVLPLGGATSTQISVAGGGQRLAKAFLIWIEPFVGQRESVHRISLGIPLESPRDDRSQASQRDVSMSTDSAAGRV